MKIDKLKCPKCKKKTIDFKKTLVDNGVELEWKKCTFCNKVCTEIEIKKILHI